MNSIQWISPHCILFIERQFDEFACAEAVGSGKADFISGGEVFVGLAPERIANDAFWLQRGGWITVQDDAASSDLIVSFSYFGDK